MGMGHIDQSLSPDNVNKKVEELFGHEESLLGQYEKLRLHIQNELIPLVRQNIQFFEEAYSKITDEETEFQSDTIKLLNIKHEMERNTTSPFPPEIVKLLKLINEMTKRINNMQLRLQRDDFNIREALGSLEKIEEKLGKKIEELKDV